MTVKIDNKRKHSIITGYLIVALIYTALVFVIPFNKPPVTWVLFAFSILSLAIGLSTCLFAFSKDYTLRSKFYGFPVFRIGVLYSLTQIIVSVIIFILTTFTDIPLWVGLALSLILLGISLIGILITDNVRDFVEKAESEESNTSKFLDITICHISEIYDSCKDETTRLSLQSLLNKLKHSDPVSSLKTAEKEAEITAEIIKLDKLVDIEPNNSIDQINKIANLLSARNRICIKNK